MWLTLAARNLALGEKDDREILALCNGCSETLLVAKDTLKRDKNRLKEINGFLQKKGYNYQGKAKVIHFVTAGSGNLGEEMWRACGAS